MDAALARWEVRVGNADGEWCPGLLPDEPPDQAADEPRTEPEQQEHERNPQAINRNLDPHWNAMKNHKAVITELPTENELLNRELETALGLEPISFCSHHRFCESKKKLGPARARTRAEHGVGRTKTEGFLHHIPCAERSCWPGRRSRTDDSPGRGGELRVQRAERKTQGRGWQRDCLPGQQRSGAHAGEGESLSFWARRAWEVAKRAPPAMPKALTEVL